MIRHIEELSMNAWPALQTLCYDGWLLRFAGGFTRRANSIYPLYLSRKDLSQKIRHCEQLYRSQNLPVIFKMTPAASPSNLDAVLADMGYEIEARTSVQILDLTRIIPDSSDGITITGELTEIWLSDVCRLNRVSPEDRLILKEMLTRIIPRKHFISLSFNGETVACGMGVFENDTMGIFDIVVAEAYRRQGHGRQLIANLLQFARASGVKKAYLQVMTDNIPAIRLYAKLGFQEIYQYWYRAYRQS